MKSREGAGLCCSLCNYGEDFSTENEFASLVLTYAIILQYFTRSSRSFARAAFHIALGLDGAMFACKMDGSLLDAFVSGKRCVLTNQPAGITPLEVRIARWIAQGRVTSIVGADAWKHLLQLLQTVGGVALDLF